MDRERMEQELAETLENGEMRSEQAGEAARRKLPARTVIRIQAQADPVAVETKQYRQMAKEVDERYSRYNDQA